MLKNQMEHIYKTIPPEDIPWNIDAPPEILQQIVAEGKIKPCRVIELGCGAGNHVIFFASQGFEATGVDFSENAIKIARKSALKKKVKCEFIVTDVLGDLHEVRNAFDFAFDWEVLHHIFPPDRDRFIRNVHRLLKPGGQYLSVCFSEQSRDFGGKGKYRKTPLDTVLYFSSERELADLFQPLFDIEELKTVDIEGKLAPHKAVYAFLIKKG